MKKEKKDDNFITFVQDEVEVIRLEKDKFFWKGEEVKDTQRIYERFCDFLKKAEVTKNKWNKV